MLPCSIVLKPLLTEENKIQRALYLVLKLNPADLKYHDLYDSTLIDEKFLFVIVSLGVALEQMRPIQIEMLRTGII